jgi:hypothetical protein
MNHPEFYDTVSSNVHSRREYMFIGKLSNVLPNPEGIVCKNSAIFTYNPFGIEVHFSIKSYKHIFPSGIII